MFEGNVCFLRTSGCLKSCLKTCFLTEKHKKEPLCIYFCIFILANQVILSQNVFNNQNFIIKRLEFIPEQSLHQVIFALHMFIGCRFLSLYENRFPVHSHTQGMPNTLCSFKLFSLILFLCILFSTIV